MLSLLTILAAASMTLSSCLGNSESEEKGTANYGGSSCLNYVTDLETNQSFVSTTPPSYTFNFNYTKGNVNIEVSSLQLAQNFSALNFQLPEMKVEADYYFMKMQGTDITPINVASQYVFSKFLARYSNRVWNGSFWPVFQISYTINNRYEVKVIPTSLLLFGTTTSTLETEDGGTSSDPYIYKGGEQNIYNFVLTPNSIDEATSTGISHTLSIRIQDACYDKNMQPLDLMIDKLPVKFDSNGYTSSISGDNVVTPKTALGSVIEKIKISDLDLTAGLSGASRLEFDITFDNYQNVSGTYHVTAMVDNFIIDETPKN